MLCIHHELFIFALIPTLSLSQGTSIQMASSMISVMGKIPVVTPRHSNVGWKLAHSHWSLAADIAMTGVKPDFIDHSLLEGGFTKGPFATLNQVAY